MSKTFEKLESLGFFKWLYEEYNLWDTDMKADYLDNLPLNDIHRTVAHSMVLKWFREKHNLLGHTYSSATGWEWEIHKNDNGTFKVGSNFSGDCLESGSYTNFEKAEIACIEQLIEIVESKN